MNRLYHIWAALIIAAVLCSCGGNSNKKEVLSSASVVFRGTDSLAVEGALLADSSKLVLPLVYAYPDNAISEYDSDRKSIDELHLKKTGYLIVTTPLYGYNVTATIFDAEENNFLNIIEYHLRKSGQYFVIKTTYDSRYFPIPDEHSYATDGLPIYRLHNDYCFVQDDKPEFESTLFCFKDVDFDGEKEFCCVLPGYNRHYFSAYKLLRRKALLMYGAPYNNLVVGDYDVSAKTTFDYDTKTISTTEQFGVTGFSENVFILNGRTRNILNPMKREFGRHMEYGGWGSLESIYQDDLLVEETQEYYLIDGNQSIAAKYININDNTFLLSSIMYCDGSETPSQILWSLKDEQNGQCKWIDNSRAITDYTYKDSNGVERRLLLYRVANNAGKPSWRSYVYERSTTTGKVSAKHVYVDNEIAIHIANELGLK